MALEAAVTAPRKRGGIMSGLKQPLEVWHLVAAAVGSLVFVGIAWGSMVTTVSTAVSRQEKSELFERQMIESMAELKENQRAQREEISDLKRQVSYFVGATNRANRSAD